MSESANERPSLLFRDAFGDPVRALDRAEWAADIDGSLLLAHGVEHGIFNLLRFGGQSQMRQHHRAGQDCADRVGDIFACQERSRTVHWLEHRSASRMN